MACNQDTDPSCPEGEEVEEDPPRDAVPAVEAVEGLVDKVRKADKELNQAYNA